VAAGEDGDEGLIDDLRLADDDRADSVAGGGGGVHGGVETLFQSLVVSHFHVSLPI
jgi:hypothetical protein